MSIPTKEKLRDTLLELERAISALHAKELHPNPAPRYRDVYEQVMKARSLVGASR